MKETEIKNEVPEVLVAPVEVEEITPSVAPVSAKDNTKGTGEPNEAFFGSLLLFCLALSLIAATGYFGFAGYRYFKQTQAEKAIPSIESLPKSEVVTTAPKEEPASAEKPVENPTLTEQSTAVDKKMLVVKVLNGGSAKGIAGSYGEKLKQAGFTKTTVGNSIGDYTGQTLYYAKGQEVASSVLKEEIIKTYSTLVVKEAPVGDKDAAVAPFVLILGR